MCRRVLAMLLVLCCLVPTFASCQSKKPADDTGNTAPAEPPVTTTPAETEDPKMDIVYETVNNPVLPSGADPWVITHNGKYYYCFAEGTTVSVSEFDGLNRFSLDNRKIVYTAPQGTAYSSEYWAPELHYIQGEWYIYVAADDGNNINHRMYVLKGTTQNPLDPFEMVGKISDATNKWAIDGTILEHNNELYFVWSGWEGNENVAQNIYIAHMSNPYTIDSPRVLLSTPTHSWERVGVPYVNEGPTVLKHGDDIFLLYSASGSWTDDYCLGMLTLTGNSPLNADHWEKSDSPVFKKRSYVAYGPGHCSFTTAVDGSIWMVYHANLESGTSWGGRSVWIAPVVFTDEGKPVFGIPARIVKFPVKNNTD